MGEKNKSSLAGSECGRTTRTSTEQDQSNLRLASRGRCSDRPAGDSILAAAQALAADEPTVFHARRASLPVVFTYTVDGIRWVLRFMGRLPARYVTVDAVASPAVRSSSQD